VDCGDGGGDRKICAGNGMGMKLWGRVGMGKSTVWGVNGKKIQEDGVGMCGQFILPCHSLAQICLCVNWDCLRSMEAI